MSIWMIYSFDQNLLDGYQACQQSALNIHWWEIIISPRNLSSEFPFVIWQSEFFPYISSQFSSDTHSALSPFPTPHHYWQFRGFQLKIFKPPLLLSQSPSNHPTGKNVLNTGCANPELMKELWSNHSIKCFPVFRHSQMAFMAPCFPNTTVSHPPRGRTAKPWLMLLLFIGNLNSEHFLLEGKLK